MCSRDEMARDIFVNGFDMIQASQNKKWCQRSSLASFVTSVC